jgi:hypothetical protein
MHLGNNRQRVLRFAVQREGAKSRKRLALVHISRSASRAAKEVVKTFASINVQLGNFTIQQMARLIIVAVLLFAFAPVALSKDYDVVVYAGTPGGIATAVAASRQGVSVLLLETTRHLGGMTTGGLSSTDVGPKPEVLGGFAHEFFQRTDEHYADDASRKPRDFWYQEPHVAEMVFNQMLHEAKVQTVFGSPVEAVEKSGQRIASFKTTDGTVYRGRVFVDASYEGDLLARAGITYIVGREGRQPYDESLAGFQPDPFRPQTIQHMSQPGSAYTHGTPAKISAYKDGKLLAGINTDWPAVGSADRRSQSYNFRVIVTTQPANRVPFPKPAHYDPPRYEILARIIDAFPGIRFEKLVYLGPIPHDKFDANASGLVQGTDHVGANVDYPEADYAARQRIVQDHIDYVQGFFWFLANDPRVPQSLRDQASQYGLARDEFVDNQNWPYALYVREARRMIGAYVMRQDDCTKSITKRDSIGMGAFILDSHAVQRLVDQEGNVIDEGNFDVAARPYQIPYRAITPLKQQCENLLVPVALSASHVAYGSIRMEPQFMILGHSAGIAAAMAIQQNQAVQDIDVSALQATLRQQHQILELQPATPASGFEGIVIDDDQATYTGDWTTSTFGSPIQGSYHHDGNADKGGKTARFEVKLPSAGKYEVRFAYVQASNRASNVPVMVESAEGTKTVLVNEKRVPSIAGHFISLGSFSFADDKPAIIVISSRDTDGYVAVDAVQFVSLR